MGDHFIPALVQKGFGSLGCRLKGGKDFPFLLLPVGIEGFILKNQKEPSGYCFSGTSVLDKLDVVTLQLLTMRIGFPLQLQPGLLQMLIDVCFFGDHLDLEFDRADL